MTLPNRYGKSMGGYLPITQEPFDIPLKDGGINMSMGPGDIEEGESPDAADVKFNLGGVSPAHPYTLLGPRFVGVGDEVIGITEYQRKNLSTVLVRHRPTAWDRWNGANWFTLPGALSGIASDRVSSVIMSDKLVVANKVDKLKVWDGSDVTPVADLSADAPVAYFIAPIGNRLVAVRVKDAGSIDPYRVAWSADGIITDWTTANLGAGAVVLEPEGDTGSPEFFMGVSALETALVLYRNRSIMLGMRTGVGSQPFRWNTVVFGLGTDASYTIANGGAQLGDFFLGSDFNVYLFDGKSQPQSVGDPIHPFLRDTNIDPLTGAFGAVDRRQQEYHLAVYDGSTWIEWVFDIAKYVKYKRLSWRRQNLGTGYTTYSFGATQAGSNPVVDTVTAIVDTVGDRVDSFAVSAQEQRLLIGDDNGGVLYNDRSQNLTSGIFTTKQYGEPQQEQTIDKVFLYYTAKEVSQAEVSISLDGGNYINPQIVNLPIGTSALVEGCWFNLTVKLFQFRIRILSGDARIHKLRGTRQARGRSAA